MVGRSPCPNIEVEKYDSVNRLSMAAYFFLRFDREFSAPMVCTVEVKYFREVKMLCARLIEWYA